MFCREAMIWYRLTIISISLISMNNIPYQIESIIHMSSFCIFFRFLKKCPHEIDKKPYIHIHLYWEYKVIAY